MSTRHLFWLVLAGFALSGCHARSSRSDEAREICLAEPSDGSPLDEAIRQYQGQARKLPTKPEQWLLVGRGWVRKARASSDPGFYINVRGCADEALHVDPGNIAALNLSALTLMNDHRFGEARKVAEETLTKQPTDTIALGTLSDSLLELGRFDEASATAQRMVDLRPDMASYSRAAYFRWLEGDGANAKLFMRYALNGRDMHDPEPAAWTFVQAATIYWNEGDYEGADSVFAEALTWMPDYPSALTGRARVALSRGQPKKAIEYLEKAHRINPLPETAWLLGDARDMLGDAAGARTEYDRVVRDGRKIDRLTLALFYATKNREADEAVRLIEAERAVRGGIYVDDAYAWALYRTGRIAEARAASDRALRLHTRDARLLYHAGVIRLAGGEPQGRDLVRQALQLNPTFDWTAAAEAERMLDDAKPSPAH